MPNHVTNNVVIQGEENRIRELLAAIQNDEFGVGSISFEKIIPMPDHIYRGDLRMDDFLKHGKDNWYTWSLANWGTKWDAYDYDVSSYGHGEWILQFHTAWSAPHPVLEQLARMYPDLTFQHEWADEDLGANCGFRKYQTGALVEEFFPENGDAVVFAANVIGIPPESLCLDKDEELIM